MKLAQRAGFQIIENGDDYFDADSTIQREILAALPHARTEQAIRALLDQPAQWQQFIQDVKSNKPDLGVRVRAILEDRSLWWMLNPPKVAIVGIPNAGKSTLANRLFGQDLSITADVPGTTRDWVGDWANFDGLPVMLLDTPGQRQTADPIEHAAIQRSGEQILHTDLVIVVLDSTAAMDSQRRICEKYSNSLLVINKIDRPAVWEVDAVDGVRTVGTTGQGIEELRLGIRRRFVADGGKGGLRWWTERQYSELQKML
jgi:small GTP-binding protein